MAPPRSQPGLFTSGSVEARVERPLYEFSSGNSRPDHLGVAARSCTSTQIVAGCRSGRKALGIHKDQQQTRDVVVRVHEAGTGFGGPAALLR
jgi:hypothetical protein